MQFLWHKRPHIPEWYDRLRERRGYTEALEEWFNSNYLPLMKEKGLEVRDRVRAIVGSGIPSFNYNEVGLTSMINCSTRDAGQTECRRGVVK